MHANPAALAGNGIHLVRFADGVETAQITAQPAFRAFVLIDDSTASALKIMLLPDSRGHDEMEVCGIHICITQDFVPGKRGKGSH